MRSALALAALLALAACGDDPKQGGTPVAADRTAPPADRPPYGEPVKARDPIALVLSGWSTARVGDYATWEVRVPGIDGVTTLTWLVTKVEGDKVRYVVRSRTAGAGGKAIAATDVVETHDAFPSAVAAGATAETITVAGKPVNAWKSAARAGSEETTVWTSPDVPLTGVVKSTGPGGAEQILVAWGRGGG